MIKSVRELQSKGKRVIVRVDYNLSLDAQGNFDPTRILASLSTLSFLVRGQSREINLLTHFGRPKGIEDKFRLLKVAEVLLKILQERKLAHLRQGFGGQARSAKRKGGVQIEIIKNKKAKSPVFSRIYHIPPNFNLYENLRFDKREKANDRGFASELAELGEAFVNDAFSVCHRSHTSVVGLSRLLPSYVGLQVQRELRELEKLQKPRRPFVVLIGGAKIEDKMPVIESLKEIADQVLVGGKVANEFLLVSKEPEEKIILPQDGINQKGAIIPFTKEKVSEDPPFDIGPQTIHLFKSILKDAQTIFWNGNLGKSEERRFIHGNNEITRFLAYKSRALRVISGGDTVAAVRNLGLLQDFDFVSTGGGATSAYLAGEKLPGIEALKR